MCPQRFSLSQNSREMQFLTLSTQVKNEWLMDLRTVVMDNQQESLGCTL